MSGYANWVACAGFTYDLNGRLLTSNQTSNSQSAGLAFAWDRWCNRMSETDTIANLQTQGLTLQQSGGAPTNRISSITTPSGNQSYSYDAAGNVLTDGTGNTYTYDAQNRLVSVSGGVAAQYGYNFANKRVKKVTGGVTTHYILQGGNVIAEHDGTTGHNLADYISTGGRFLAKITSTGTVYFLRDWLSERLELDASGNVLGAMGALPFGGDMAESGQQEKHHFTSYERDSETGLDYANNRLYSSGSGRFQSIDPYKVSSAASNPQTLNRYAYVTGDPINSFDPSGLYELIANSPGDVPDDCVPVAGTEDSDFVTYDCQDGNNIAPDSGGSGGGGGPGCQFGFDGNKHDKAKGQYPVDPSRAPNIVPQSQNFGPGTDFRSGDWYYYFEAYFTPDDGVDPLDWNIQFSGTVNGTVAVNQGKDQTVSESKPDDTPLAENFDQAYNYGFAWVDAPGWGFLFNGSQVTSANLTFVLTYTATPETPQSGVGCAATLRLHLTVSTDSKGNTTANWDRPLWIATPP